MINRRILFYGLLLCLLATAIQGFSQDIKITSGFLKDSIKIGEPTGFYLTAKYPSELTILFPDSTFDFTPFEYESKQYFPTRTNQSESVDSVVYYLSTFEIDSILYLSLPVYQVNDQDCTVVNSSNERIYLTLLVSAVPDSVSAEQLPLKTNTSYVPVFLQFNYPFAAIILGALVIIVLIVVFVFGKRILRFFRIRKLKKNHQAFIEKYAQYLNMIGKRYDRQEVETLLFIWKKYLEKLEGIPYTKMTTKETLNILNEDSVGNNLKAVDRAIYGNHPLDMLTLEGLLDFASIRFTTTLDQIQHG